MKSIAVLGGGESGVGAALLAKKKGIDVFVSDYGVIAPKYKQELINNNISFEEKGHDFERLENTDIIVKSPGIPDSSEVIQHFRLRHKEIVSEIELASRFYEGKVIAITGSNGKTTTTSLIYHLISSSGLNVGLGGNIGHSFARLLSTDEHFDCVVLELSSFQLDQISSFSAEISIVLNITPDHLDRYDYDMNKYAQAKWNLAMHTDPQGCLIINSDDEWTQKMKNQFAVDCEIISYSANDTSQKFFSKEGNVIEIEKHINLLGRHNVFNAIVAAKAAQMIGIDTKTILNRLSTFKAIEHRLESVTILDGITFVNDSKATNVDSVFVALDSMTAPVIWIAGGVDKGNDYAALDDLVKQKVKALICLTKDDEKLRSAFESMIDSISTTENVDQCIKMALEQADEGDVVLLSPACASFDLFNNYEHRGKAFKESIKKFEHNN